MERVFETHFEIYLKEDKHILLASKVYIGEEFIRYIDLEENIIFKLKKEGVESIFCRVYGPMNSFGSNCGEIKERIY